MDNSDICDLEVTMVMWKLQWQVKAIGRLSTTGGVEATGLQ